MSKKILSLSLGVCVRILAKRTRTKAHVRVRLEFWQNAHVHAMCVRPKIKCANVRACEAENHRNSQFGKKYKNGFLNEFRCLKSDHRKDYHIDFIMGFRQISLK